MIKKHLLAFLAIPLAMVSAQVQAEDVDKSALVSTISTDGWECTGSSTWHVNTWSGEGANDGSNMTTPFMEYWTASGGILDDATITMTLTGLDAGVYEFSALVRTLNEAGGVTPFGMTITANDNYAYACAGNACTNGTYDTYSVIGVVGSDGQLVVGFKLENVNFNWLAFKDMKLTYKSELSDIKAALQTLIDDCAETENEKMSTSVSSALATAKSNAQEVYGNADATQDDVTSAIVSLSNALSDADECVSAYAALNTSIGSYAEKAAALDEAGQAAYVVSDIVTSYTNGTYTATQAIYDAIEALAAAYRTAVAAQTTAGTDMTVVLINPDFEDGFTGWENAGGMWTQTNENLTKKYVEKWNETASDLGDASVKQSVTLNEGCYTLKAQVCARNLSAQLYVKVGDETTSVETDGAEQAYYSVTFQVTADGTAVEVGYLTDGTIDGYSSGDGWFAIDNVSLTYVIKEVDETAVSALIATIPEGKMNKDVETNLNTAKENLESDMTLDNYIVLQSAIVEANASIEAYKTSRSVLDEVASFLTNTWGLTSNVYSQDALDSYEKQYDEATLTDALAYGSKNDGVLPDVLLDGWDGRGAQDWAGGTLYINTWSIEGDNDGSSFVTPFYEVWNWDNATLQAKTYTKTISGLEAGETYAVSAWVRVRISNDQTEALTGISLQAGDGEAVDVCTGEQVGTSQLYLGTFTAIGTADADGNLTVKFVVADGSNASWLSFKNLKCSRTVTITEKGAYVEDGTTYYYATYCTPTAVDLDECDFTAYAVTVSTDAPVYTELSGIVPAGTPMVVKSTAAGTYAATIGLGEATEVTDNDLTVSDGTVEGDGKTIYILANGSDGLAWYLCNEGTTIPAGVCYLTVNANGVKSIGIHGIVDAISSVVTEQSKSCVRYNLSGQRVGNSYKGVVIENGKKYLVK